MGSLAVSTVALIVSFIVLGINMRARTKTRANLREAEANLAEARERFRRLDQPVDHKYERPSPVLTPEQWEAVYGETYREMGEQQAESREARRDRAVNRPRGQAGTEEGAE